MMEGRTCGGSREIPGTAHERIRGRGSTGVAEPCCAQYRGLGTRSASRSGERNPPNRIEAVRAIDRAITSREEGNQRFFSALRANDAVHLALARAEAAPKPTTRIAGAPVGGSAIGAASGLVGKAFARVKLLLTGGEGEVLTAVTTGENSVGVHALAPRHKDAGLLGQRGIVSGGTLCASTVPCPGWEQAADPVPGCTIARMLRFCAHFARKNEKGPLQPCLK